MSGKTALAILLLCAAMRPSHADDFAERWGTFVEPAPAMVVANDVAAKPRHKKHYILEIPAPREQHISPFHCQHIWYTRAHHRYWRC